jgi:ribosomal protein S20
VQRNANRRWGWILTGALAALAVVGGLMFGATRLVSAAQLTSSDLETMTQVSTMPGLIGRGYLAHGGRWGRMGLGGSIDYAQLLADALGISVDDLQTAYDNARTAAIQQAVDEGLITQEQADTMQVWGGLSGRGFGFLHFGRGLRGSASGGLDEDALLADALNITTEKLQAAREQANQAALDEAVAQGIITQEQADQMLAQQNLASYLDRNTLLAQALGMSVEDLRAAYDNGKTLSSLMAEKGLDAATVHANLVDAYNSALAQAVTDGVITQDQADQMQNRLGFGPMLGGMGGGFRGHGGFCGPRGDITDNGTGSDTGFRMPGRMIQGDDSL